MTFKSSNTGIATVGKVKYVKKSGYYYAYTKVMAVKGGKATITAKAKYGSKTTSWKLTVKDSAVTYSIKTNRTLYVGAVDDHVSGLQLMSTQNGVTTYADPKLIQSVTVAESGITATANANGYYRLKNIAAMTTNGEKTTTVTAVVKVGSTTKTLTCDLKYSDAAPVATTLNWKYYDEKAGKSVDMTTDTASFSMSYICGEDASGDEELDPSKTVSGYYFENFENYYWLQIDDQYSYAMKDTTVDISNRTGADNIKAMLYEGYADLYYAEGTTPTAGTFDLTIKSGSISKTIHVTATGSLPEHSVAAYVVGTDGTHYGRLYKDQSATMDLAKYNITTAAQLADFVNKYATMIITDAYGSIVDPTGMVTIEYTPKSGTAKALSSAAVVTSDKRLHVAAGDGTPAAGDVIKVTFTLSSTNVYTLTVTLK